MLRCTVGDLADNCSLEHRTPLSPAAAPFKKTIMRDLRHRTLVPWHLFHSTTVAIPHANVPLIEVGSLQAALALSIISDVVAILGFGFDSGPVA